MTSVERVGDAELHAYVDGQLDVAGRLEVEDHLSRHPELAARVMSDMRARDALRLAFTNQRTVVEPRNIVAADRLSKALNFRRFAVPLQRLAAAVAIFALGWSAHTGWTELKKPSAQTVSTQSSSSVTPAAHGLNHVAMSFDPAKLGQALDVKLPRVPAGWKVVGAEIVQSGGGTGVQMTFETPEFGRLSLLARHTRDVGIVLPTIAKNTAEPTAYWQLVSDTYALTADLPRQPLEFAALELFQTLY
ncbi:anti-sigma factor family protein [Flaviflagellibacter deserti]|uniref:Anti-sigma factor family protein n=1 Tax=Flaviflagellibacter deserti TaxID=2267266 RepID=A0ABV9Z3P0_9HYPH